MMSKNRDKPTREEDAGRAESPITLVHSELPVYRELYPKKGSRQSCWWCPRMAGEEVPLLSFPRVFHPVPLQRPHLESMPSVGF